MNLFGTLGWQGTCRQGKVPAQSYVSTAGVLEYRLHCNTRDMEGKARRVQGYGYVVWVWVWVWVWARGRSRDHDQGLGTGYWGTGD